VLYYHIMGVFRDLILQQYQSYVKFFYSKVHSYVKFFYSKVHSYVKFFVK